MAKKERRATDNLNLALSGLEQALRFIKQRNQQPELAPILDDAQRYAEQVREHLLTIQFHTAQI